MKTVDIIDIDTNQIVGTFSIYDHTGIEIEINVENYTGSSFKLKEDIKTVLTWNDGTEATIIWSLGWN
mgnify:CR=1 FL=1